MSEEVEAKVQEVLASHQSLFLATSQDDRPWVAGGFFAESDPFRLVMVLEERGTTLTNIKANPHVAVVVSSGDAYSPFLQGNAEVELVDDSNEVEEVKAALVAKAPQIEPFFGAPIQAVRLNVQCWRATDVKSGWLPGKLLERASA